MTLNLHGLAARGLLPEVPWYGVAVEPLAVDPARVAFAGCWHGREDLFPAAMQQAAAAGATMLVHTGDFLFAGQVAAVAARVMEEAAADLGLHVVAVRGNHDDPALYAKAVTATRRRARNRADWDGFARLTPHVWHAPNGHRWTWGGVEFVALGGAHSVDRPRLTEGRNWWPGEVASARDLAAVRAGGPAQVLVTHDVPTGLHLPVRLQPDWWDLAGAERHHALIREAVDAVQPDWLIAGHMHLRLTDGLWLESGHQVRVEVLNKIESGVADNLLVADLADGQITLLDD